MNSITNPRDAPNIELKARTTLGTVSVPVCFSWFSGKQLQNASKWPFTFNSDTGKKYNLLKETELDGK